MSNAPAPASSPRIGGNPASHSSRAGTVEKPQRVSPRAVFFAGRCEGNDRTVQRFIKSAAPFLASALMAGCTALQAPDTAYFNQTQANHALILPDYERLLDADHARGNMTDAEHENRTGLIDAQRSLDDSFRRASSPPPPTYTAPR